MALFNPLNFRENIADSKYILLLPLIGAYELWNSDDSGSKSHLFPYYLLINASIVLFAYRFNVSFSLFILFNVGIFIFVHQTLFNLFPIGFLLLIFNVIALKTLRTLAKKYSKCFTFAEFAIVFQCINYYLISIITFNWQYWIDGEFTAYRKLDKFCLICYSTLAFHWIVAKWIRISGLDPIIYLISFPLSLYGFLYHFLHIEPLYWFFNFLSFNQTRIYLLLFWSLVLLLTLLFAYIHTFHTVHRATTTATRKIFHLAISLVYITGIKYDVILLDFASKLILFIFIFIEIIRLSNIPVIISIINTIFDRFRDEKDSGILTLSHIYLLVGCSSPLWLCNNLHHSNQISLASGIMAIGIGDTIASVVGITYGNRRWPKSRKTYLGTFGFFLSHTLSFNSV
ncbi:hypothetical protein HUG17_5545 [Dermatophagoides farinae]|uniref:dolichol kinase n=1 Tax=Dermatophagoides farinae TaxID=6954 RepID=A0A9D4P3R1_DERFA|nr:hypothetical protein HUG17_5545 [Dermatophagoides farinae]